MRRVIQALISVAAITVILAGAPYAIARETLRDTNLQNLYEQINQESFEGKLPYVPVSWDDLTEFDADGKTDFDNEGNPISIELAQNYITDEHHLRDVLRHETCHVFVGETKFEHGPEWQDCMTRFQ